MENKIINYINQTPENTNPSVLATLLSGLNKQSDYSQNNSAEADYIKNRPFYEEVKLFVEGNITDDNYILPESKYELGKLYIVEVDGVQHYFEFITTTTGEGMNYVGFNIRGGRYGVTSIDSTKPFLSCNIGPASPTDGLYSLAVQNITKPAYVRVLQQVIRKIDPKYIPIIDLEVSEISGGQYSITNVEQLKQIYDNDMCVHIVYLSESSGYSCYNTIIIPNIKSCMLISESSGVIIGSEYSGAFSSLYHLYMTFNGDDYAEEIFTPLTARLTMPASNTLVKIYAAPF